MGAPDLIFQLRNAGYSIQVDGEYLEVSPADNFPSEWVEQLKQHKPEILAVLELERQRQQDIRREKVLVMLEADPCLKRAVHADCASDPMNVIITVAIRHVAICEMSLPKASYDPWQLLMLLDKCDAEGVH